MLFPAALAVALSLFAAKNLAAANQAEVTQAKKPALSQHGAGNAAAELKEFKDAAKATPPSLCNPCVFYGGDLNPTDPNAAGLSDENTFYVSDSSTYAALTIPAGSTVVVKGALFNVQASAAFDPMTATYDLRTGISEGNGGSSLASGTAKLKVVATGRSFNGTYEYTIAVKIPKLTLPSGEYWFNITPTCLNTLDGSCYIQRQFASNTTQGANNIHGSWQPPNSAYLNSSSLGYAWANWCDSSLGLNQIQCAALSFGVIGEVQ